MEKNNMLKLFESSTRSQIFWNLIVYKELSAGQLATMLKKNISTITRNLEVMKDANLIQLSKVDSRKNLQIKFWKFNSDIFKEPSIIEIDKLDSLSPSRRKEIITQIKNFLLLSQSIIQNILYHNIQEQDDTFNLAMFLFDQKTGKIFDKEIQEFLQGFIQRHKTKLINIEKLSLDTHIYFILRSQIKSSVPPKE